MDNNKKLLLAFMGVAGVILFFQGLDASSKLRLVKTIVSKMEVNAEKGDWLSVHSSITELASLFEPVPSRSDYE